MRPAVQLSAGFHCCSAAPGGHPDPPPPPAGPPSHSHLSLSPCCRGAMPPTDTRSLRPQQQHTATGKQRRNSGGGRGAPHGTARLLQPEDGAGHSVALSDQSSLGCGWGAGGAAKGPIPKASNTPLLFAPSYGRVYAAADPYHHTIGPAATYSIGTMVRVALMAFLCIPTRPHVSCSRPGGVWGCGRGAEQHSPCVASSPAGPRQCAGSDL